MKHLALIFASLAAMAMPAAALADTHTIGISGYVYDLQTRAPEPNVTVSIYRLPMTHADARPVSVVKTDGKGFFSELTLRRVGRYAAVANTFGSPAGCAVSDLYYGVVAHVKINTSPEGVTCEGANVRTSLFIPGETADIYIVH